MNNHAKSSDTGRAEEKAEVRGNVELYALQIAEKAVEEAEHCKTMGDHKGEMLASMAAVVFAQIAFDPSSTVERGCGAENALPMGTRPGKPPKCSANKAANVP